MSIHGREAELAQLTSLRAKHSASLVVVTGRRRIGKSTLVQEFGRSFSTFYEFQGLAPRPNQSTKEQLEAFSAQYCAQFDEEATTFSDWYEALRALANKTQRSETLIFLDEISWLGSGDRDFPGKLKIVWDTLFKNNPRLVLVLCGSVSSWIEENILEDSGFVGRVSLVMRLGELPLSACGKFWGNREKRVSSFEKLKFLSVCGGIPKYLEELRPQDSIDENIKRLCFTPGGYLFEDFDRIFADIFGKRCESYLKIIEIILTKRLSAKEIGERFKHGLDRQLSSYLRELTLAGFLRRDTRAKLTDLTSERGSLYRIADNYLRFYLRYIHKKAAAIQNGLFEFSSLDGLIGWESLLGLQFENLILNRIPEIIKALQLGNETIEAAGPFRQPTTTRSKGVQVDLLLKARSDTFYVCEIKFRRQIDDSVIKEVARKLSDLKFPKRTSVRPVLIYAGEVDPSVEAAEFFDRVLNVERLLG